MTRNRNGADKEHDLSTQDATMNAMDAELAAEMGDELGAVPLGLGVKHLPAVPSVREVRTLLECASGEPRDYLMVRLLYYTGIRVSELVALRFVDVSFDEATLFIRGGKEKRDRYVCVDATSLKLIRQWQGERPPSEPVIGLETSQIEHLVHDYGLKAGLVQKYEAMERSFSPHSLRHSFATHRHDAGMDLVALKRLLGHQFLSTTLIYVETSMRHLRKQYRKTDPLQKK